MLRRNVSTHLTTTPRKHQANPAARMRIKLSSKTNDITAPRTTLWIQLRAVWTLFFLPLYFFPLTWWTRGHASKRNSWPWLGKKSTLGTKCLAVAAKPPPPYRAVLVVLQWPPYRWLVSPEPSCTLTASPCNRFESPAEFFPTVLVDNQPLDKSAGLARKAFAFVLQLCVYKYLLLCWPVHRTRGLFGQSPVPFSSRGGLKSVKVEK